MGVMDAHGDLSDSHYLLHGHEYKFHRQEADTLVKEVQGAEENQVPLGREHRVSGRKTDHQGSLGGEAVSRSPSSACRVRIELGNGEQCVQDHCGHCVDGSYFLQLPTSHLPSGWVTPTPNSALPSPTSLMVLTRRLRPAGCWNCC